MIYVCNPQIRQKFNKIYEKSFNQPIQYEKKNFSLIGSIKKKDFTILYLQII
jgi:hypothetical protein